MKQELLEKLHPLKAKYAAEGFIIIGVFGSFARGEETEHSDIDILYRCTDAVLLKYRGWAFFGYHARVKSELEKALGRSVDLADQQALSNIGKKYILPELVYVS
jgi:uncharacterized protein